MGTVLKGINDSGVIVGSVNSNTYFLATPVTLELAVSISGEGNGSITSNPSGIDCGSACKASFEKGDTVILTARPIDEYSSFSEWSGCTTSTGNECSVVMNDKHNVTATFVYVKPFRLIYQSATTDYNSLVDAYGVVSDNDSATIYGRIFTDTDSGSFTLSRPVTLAFKGGYNTDFDDNSSGYTTLQGGLTVARGSLTLERLIIH
jgi:hypothetical protein